MKHGETMATQRRTGYRPGLRVSVTTRPDDMRHARYTVRARVDEAAVPLTLSLHVDGDLVDTDVSATAVHEFAAAEVPPGRHVMTVRAVAGDGRWGGASTVVECVASADPVPP